MQYRPFGEKVQPLIAKESGRPEILKKCFKSKEYYCY